MKRPFPDRRKLEIQCVSAIAFVKNEADLLDSPIWIMLINVVALEMLKAKMPGGNIPVELFMLFEKHLYLLYSKDYI